MRTDNIGFYIVRAIAYWLTSACALLAGYLIQVSDFQWRELLLLAIPAITAFFFFILYAARFHSLEYRTDVERQIGMVLERQVIYVVPVVAVLLILWILTTQAWSWRILVAFGLYAAMFVYYGIILSRLPFDASGIRHRLFWSILLSIGISLYYGLSFSLLKVSLRPLVPIAAVVLTYYLSEKFEWRRTLFLRRMLGIALALIVLVVLAQTGVVPIPDRLAKISQGLVGFFWSLLFCVAASAYVGVFEAWKVTSDISIRDPLKETATKHNGDILFDRAAQYSIATLLASMLAVSALPLFFIYSQYGTLFLIGFVIHATISFLFWYLYGRGPHLKSLPWGALKIISGVLFLALLVLATFINVQPTNHFLKWFASENGLTIMSPFVGYLGWRLYRNFRKVFKRSRKSIALRLLDTRVNFTRLLSLLCWAACFAIVTLLHSRAENSVEYYKAELAFSAYVLCIILCLVVEALDSIGMIEPKTAIRNSIAGVLVLIRIVPSTLIALCVFVPAVYKGETAYHAFLHSAPFFLAAVGGFALNDYCDAAKDFINKPYRAIPSSRIPKSAVGIISLSCLATALLLAIFVSESSLAMLLYVVTIAGVSFYNVFVKYVSLTKTVLTSTISSLPLLYSVVIFDYPLLFLTLPIATCLFVLGREWLMDTQDMRGDRAAGTLTLPMLIGPQKTAILGFAFQILSVMTLLPIAVLAQSTWNLTMLHLIVSAILLSMCFWKRKNYQRHVIRALWIPMLLGLLMMLG